MKQRLRLVRGSAAQTGGNRRSGSAASERPRTRIPKDIQARACAMVAGVIEEMDGLSGELSPVTLGIITHAVAVDLMRPA